MGYLDTLHYTNIVLQGHIVKTPVGPVLGFASKGGTRMTRYVTVVTVLVLSVFALGASSLRASPPIGAVVQTWHYDPQSNAVTATIVNTSQKDITGYNITLKETYANGGVRNHEMLFDYVGKIGRAHV